MSQEHVQTRTLSPEAQAALDAGDVDALLTFHRQTFGGHVMELGGDGGDTGGDNGQDGGDQGDSGDQGTGDGDQDNGDQDDDSDDARVQRANRQAANYRTQLRETQQQLQQVQQAQEQTTGVLNALRSALGLDSGDSTDGEQDPAAQVSQLTEQVQNLTTTNQQLQASLLVHELASEASANPVALLDSRRFAEQLADMDASAEDYRAQVLEAMKDAVSKNTAYRSGQGSSRGGSELNGDQREQTKRRPAGLAAAIGGHYGK